jgi:hypothetical protein
MSSNILEVSGELLALVETGRQKMIAAREEKAGKQEEARRLAAQEITAAWNGFEEDVYRQLPAALHPYLVIPRSDERKPDYEAWVDIQLDQGFMPMRAVFEWMAKVRGEEWGWRLTGWHVAEYEVEQHMDWVEKWCIEDTWVDYSKYSPDLLDVALAVSKGRYQRKLETIEQHRPENENRQAYVQAYEAWQAEVAAVRAANGEKILTWQACLGTSYRYWELTFGVAAQNDEGVYSAMDTVRVLRPNPDAEGFYTVISYDRRVRRVRYFNPVCVAGPEVAYLGECPINPPYWRRLEFPETHAKLFVPPSDEVYADDIYQQVQAQLAPLPVEPEYQSYGLASAEACWLRGEEL